MLDSVMNDRTQSSPRKLNKPKPIALLYQIQLHNHFHLISKSNYKNGKRRIQPMLISSGNSCSSDLPRSNSVIKPVVNTTKSTMEFENHLILFRKSFINKTKDLELKKLLEVIITKLKREMEPVKFIGSVILNPNTSFSKIRLATPKVRLFPIEK